jgi:hypothetical protein
MVRPFFPTDRAMVSQNGLNASFHGIYEPDHLININSLHFFVNETAKASQIVLNPRFSLLLSLLFMPRSFVFYARYMRALRAKPAGMRA